MNGFRALSGFTLVELLTVLAILGAVMGIFSLLLLRSLRQSEVRQAAAQLAGDLRRSRADAQQTGQDSSLTLDPGKTTYTMQAGTAAPQLVEVPNRVTVTALSGGARVTYQPPFGTLGGGGAVWKVQGSAPDLTLYVKVVGITGKVMVSGTAE